MVTDFYGIWTASAQDTGYKLDAFEDSFPSTIMDRSIEEAKSQRVYPELFAKLNHYARDKHLKRIEERINALAEGRQSAAKECPIESYMSTATIFYQNLLKYYPADFVQDKIFDESDPNYPTCPEIAYKFHKSI